MHTRPAAAFVLFLAGSALGQATLTGLGAPTSGVGFPGADARAISADGSTVCGDQTQVDLPSGYRWTSAAGRVVLPQYPGSGSAQWNTPWAISADGQTIVGVVATPTLLAYRWTASGGYQLLGSHNGFAAGEAYGVSADGSVVVGSFSFDQIPLSGQHAFRWTQATGPVPIGPPPGGPIGSIAYAVSPDGRFVVGAIEDGSGGQQAFLYDQGGGLRMLGDLEGGAISSTARALSADGSVVVGESVSSAGTEAFIWSPGTGMQRLSGLVAGTSASSALAVSADGSVVGGYGLVSPGAVPEAFIWTASSGAQTLRTLLAHGGVDVHAWGLYEVSALSADGRTIAGSGAQTSAGGAVQQGFVATLGSLCYANCDGSTTPPVLNVNDFICFQSRFAAGESYANCDLSTAPPTLNVNDFICFMRAFAVGCH